MASIACSMFISYDKEVGQSSSSKLVRKNNERILLRGIGNKKGFLKKNLLHKNSKKVILLTTSFKTYFQFKSIGFHPTFEEKNVMNKWREMQITTVAGVLALLLFVVPSANAVDVGETYSCILKGCWVEMLKCIANPSCAASIACIESCNNRPDEIECEVRCGDLFQNNVINEFNNCAVSRKKCIKQKMDTGEYPVPDPGALVKNFKVGDLSGNWYITSGLNPIFDHFDCQTQEFHIESNDVLMANLSWRISTPGGGFFTRSTTLRFVQDQFQAGILHNHGNDYLNYQDDWYILSSKIENTEDDYVFVYYRGSNDAWDGYGGSIVFTKSSVLPDSIVPELVTTSKKIGLDFDRFIKLDNTCGPQPPLFERLRSLWKK